MKSEMKLIARRVDALRIRARVEWAPELKAELKRVHEQSAKNGAAPVGIVFAGELADGRRWELACKYVASDTRTLSLQTEELGAKVRLDKDDQHGVNVDLSIRAVALMRLGWHGSVRLLRTFLWSLGRVDMMRLARIDLAADLQAWPLHWRDIEAFVLKGHTKTGWRPARSGELAVWSGIGGVPGTIYVGKRASGTQCRIYDKTQELSDKKSKTKLELEHAAWKRGGWDGRGRVTRCEFELTGRALRGWRIKPLMFGSPADERGNVRLLSGELLEEQAWRDHPAVLPSGREVPDEGLDGLWYRFDGWWAYLTQEWLRIALLDTATRKKNAKTDPRWIMVQAVTWDHPAAPERRVFFAEGASRAQAIGTVLSTLAKESKLDLDSGLEEVIAGFARVLLEAEDAVKDKILATVARFSRTDELRKAEALEEASVVVRDTRRRYGREDQQSQDNQLLQLVDQGLERQQAAEAAEAAKRADAEISRSQWYLHHIGAHQWETDLYWNEPRDAVQDDAATPSRNAQLQRSRRVDTPIPVEDYDVPDETG